MDLVSSANTKLEFSISIGSRTDMEFSGGATCGIGLPVIGGSNLVLFKKYTCSAFQTATQAMNEKAECNHDKSDQCIYCNWSDLS